MFARKGRLGVWLDGVANIHFTSHQELDAKLFCSRLRPLGIPGIWRGQGGNEYIAQLWASANKKKENYTQLFSFFKLWHSFQCSAAVWKTPADLKTQEWTRNIHFRTRCIKFCWLVFFHTLPFDGTASTKTAFFFPLSFPAAGTQELNYSSVKLLSSGWATCPSISVSSVSFLLK